MAAKRKKTPRTEATPTSLPPTPLALAAAAVDLDALAMPQLRAMHEAGQRVKQACAVLAKTGDNVVGELLRHQGTFYEWDHYPTGDVYDGETHGQYYYHAHPAQTRGDEHGHFHTFLRPKGMPQGIKPLRVADYKRPKDKNDALSHLIGISMDRAGVPISLFTTNRWVTGEYWYRATDVAAMLPVFEISHAQPSWPVNIWISNMIQLFQPHITQLLALRDQAVADWQRQHPKGNVYEDRVLEVTSTAAIDVDAHIQAVEQAIARRATPTAAQATG